MKTGKDIRSLAIELERRRTLKRDFVVRTESAQMGVVEGTSTSNNLVLAFGDQATSINDIAHSQIADHTGIPARYYAKMRAEAPHLLADNVNEWFKRYPAPRMVRTLDNRARAFMSDKYRPLENEDLANAALPAIARLGVEIISCDVTDRRFYVKAVDRRIEKDIPTGNKLGDGSHVFFDTLSPAIVIENSEVGMGALSVKTSIFTKVCTNLCTIDKAGSLRQYHIGGKHEIGEDVYAMLSDKTRRLNDAALWAKVGDIIQGAFDAARFAALVDDKIVGMTERKIAGDPVKAIDLTSKTFGFNEIERSNVLRHLIEGGDLTQYGLFNAITRTAEDIDDYDRATDFERFGGKMIELPKNEWKLIAEAA
jgi:hypothetical protein